LTVIVRLKVNTWRPVLLASLASREVYVNWVGRFEFPHRQRSLYYTSFTSVDYRLGALISSFNSRNRDQLQQAPSDYIGFLVLTAKGMLTFFLLLVMQLNHLKGSASTPSG
jgi:hypothetical protein